MLPPFAKAAWLNISPEYNPYKYNSFPVNAARQSWLLTQALQEQMGRDAREHRLNQLPPVLAFQSVMDSTVSTRAVVTGLFDLLPANGSELVVFDINQPPASVLSLNRRRGRRPLSYCLWRKGVTVSRSLPMPARTALPRWRK